MFESSEDQLKRVSYRIRRAQVSDISDIVRIEFAAADFEGRLKPFDFSHAELEQLWRDRLHSSEFDVLVAESGHTLLGFIAIKAPLGGEGFIQAIYIDPDFHRCGIGSQLLRVSEQLFLSRSCKRIKLLVEPLNHNAKRFYSKAGYRATHEKFRHLSVWIKEL